MLGNNIPVASYRIKQRPEHLAETSVAEAQMSLCNGDLVVLPNGEVYEYDKAEGKWYYHEPSLG
ncbi:hypothetical protein KKG24_04320 [Patescibacteria group bacterium]|nr:hypothetical protein [Patescibacteria group bacterium]